MPHTSCYRGKRVRVVLRSGEVFVDRFHERTGHFIVFKDRGRIPRGDIAAFSIFKANLPQ